MAAREAKSHNAAVYAALPSLSGHDTLVKLPLSLHPESWLIFLSRTSSQSTSNYLISASDNKGHLF